MSGFTRKKGGRKIRSAGKDNCKCRRISTCVLLLVLTEPLLLKGVGHRMICKMVWSENLLAASILPYDPEAWDLCLRVNEVVFRAVHRCLSCENKWHLSIINLQLDFLKVVALDADCF